MDTSKEKIENNYRASQKELEVVGTLYTRFYDYRSQRSGAIRQLDGLPFEEYLKQSRELFWNSIITEQSEDLANLGLELKLPFVRKELLEFVSRMVALNVNPKLHGDNLHTYSVKVLNALYTRWRFKNNDKVEKFWDILYGAMNGTTCKYVGYNNREKKQRFLKAYDPETGSYSFEEKNVKYWDDVESKIIPIENIYLSKIYERNIQKQGRLIWKEELDVDVFHLEFGIYPDAKYVLPGNRIAEDSLYFRLLSGCGIKTNDKIQVLRFYDDIADEFIIVANGIWLNKLGKGENIAIMPNPFHHKNMPFTWSLFEAIDEKFAYGLSLAFKEKSPHKLLNASYMMNFERELRAINRPILSSDIESPEIVYKTGKVIPVSDVTAYKELEMGEASQAFYTTLNSIQQWMTTSAQGGSTNIVPSVQPKSAKEVSQMDQMRQMAMGCSLLMYYDMIRQEVLLVLKTMLQFYSNKQYSSETGSILRAITVPNSPLTEGGTGNLKVQIVDKLEDPLLLKYRSIVESVREGKKTEIIQMLAEAIQKLEVGIEKIELTPEKTDDVEQAMFQEKANYLGQYVQMGLIDPAKLLITTLQKFGIHPSDVMPDKIMPQMFAQWQSMQNPANAIKQQPQQMGQMQGANRTSQTGQMQQSVMGQAYGAQSNGGQGANVQ